MDEWEYLQEAKCGITTTAWTSAVVTAIQKANAHSSPLISGLAFCNIKWNAFSDCILYTIDYDFCSAPFSSGICVCKTGVYGPKCDECHPGFFHFSSTGCRPCQCHNRTNYCHPQSGESAEDVGVRCTTSFCTFNRLAAVFLFIKNSVGEYFYIVVLLLLLESKRSQYFFHQNDRAYNYVYNYVTSPDSVVCRRP